MLLIQTQLVGGGETRKTILERQPIFVLFQRQGYRCK